MRPAVPAARAITSTCTSAGQASTSANRWSPFAPPAMPPCIDWPRCASGFPSRWSPSGSSSTPVIRYSEPLEGKQCPELHRFIHLQHDRPFRCARCFNSVSGNWPLPNLTPEPGRHHAERTVLCLRSGMSPNRPGDAVTPRAPSGPRHSAKNQRQCCPPRNRKARLLEIDPCYVDVIVQRWQQYTGKTAILAADGRSFDVTTHDRLDMRNQVEKPGAEDAGRAEEGVAEC
jgi:hypothetical protein